MEVIPQKTILVTGASGFIGYHLCLKLISLGHNVVGLDNINAYYDINLKMARLNELGIKDVSENTIAVSETYGDSFHFIKINLEDQVCVDNLFKKYKFEMVCNLAAQAGVRYSLEDPMVYVQSNIVGFVNLLECMRHHNVKKLVYASSSSVYGNSNQVPFQINENVDKPISLYAASKKTNELIAHTYSHLFNIKTIGLRFFTVYGPWGRPDMAMFLFTEAIFKNKPIKVFNNGNLSRDFTYVDDVIEGVIATLLIDKEDCPLYELYNIGNSQPVKLMDFISEIEKVTGKEATKDYLPMQPGDVEKTWADSSGLEKTFGYKPSTSISVGVKKFVDWYKIYYNI
jgi:UDP-glucuronate 4-epimerase